MGLLRLTQTRKVNQQELEERPAEDLDAEAGGVLTDDSFSETSGIASPVATPTVVPGASGRA